MTRCVYFLRPVGQSGPVKIGCSTDPIGRLQSYLNWSPIPLEVVATLDGDWALEWAFHARFAHLHSHHEWFRADPAIDATIASIVDRTFDPNSLPAPKRLRSAAQVEAWSRPRNGGADA